MSLVITTYVHEGIVMASDSRLTINQQNSQEDGQPVITLSLPQSDSNYKAFVTPNNVGISTFGAADISGVPLAGYIESFIVNDAAELTVDEVAHALLQHFRSLPSVPDVMFHIAGYMLSEAVDRQHVFEVRTKANQVRRLNPLNEQGQPVQGASWGGQADILARLLQPVGVLRPDGDPAPLPHHQIPWQFLTLQDAVDFSIFAIRSTIDALRFQPRPKSVGGPIDVLVIKPDGSAWIQRKQLRAA